MGRCRGGCIGVGLDAGVGGGRCSMHMHPPLHVRHYASAGNPRL